MEVQWGIIPTRVEVSIDYGEQDSKLKPLAYFNKFYSSVVRVSAQASLDMPLLHISQLELGDGNLVAMTA